MFDKLFTIVMGLIMLALGVALNVMFIPGLLKTTDDLPLFLSGLMMAGMWTYITHVMPVQMVVDEFRS